MAVTSGTVYTNAVSSLQNTRFRLDWSVTSQDISTNTTTISWAVYFENHWEFYTNAVKVNSVVINGTTVYSNGTFSNLKYETVKLCEGTATIAHGTDGTKSFTASLSCWTYSNTSYTGSGTFELPSITRGTMFWGVNGSWQRCLVYWGVGGQWKQVIPYWGTGGAWKQIGG